MKKIKVLGCFEKEIDLISELQERKIFQKDNYYLVTFTARQIAGDSETIMRETIKVKANMSFSDMEIALMEFLESCDESWCNVELISYIKF